MVNARVRVATNEFIEAGGYEMPRPIDASIINISLSEMPDVENERYDATSQTKRRLATQQEKLDSITNSRTNQSNSIDIDPMIQAAIRLDFEERQKLQVKAGQTLKTAAECKARLKEIYQSLL